MKVDNEYFTGIAKKLLEDVRPIIENEVPKTGQYREYYGTYLKTDTKFRDLFVIGLFVLPAYNNDTERLLRLDIGCRGNEYGFMNCMAIGTNEELLQKTFDPELLQKIAEMIPKLIEEFKH